jgi:hypothetical protein
MVYLFRSRTESGGIWVPRRVAWFIMRHMRGLAYIPRTCHRNSVTERRYHDGSCCYASYKRGDGMTDSGKQWFRGFSA